MEKPNRFLAVLAYLLLLVGPLLILIFARRSRFSVYHACQSLAIVLAAVVVPLVWLVIGWIFAFLSVTAPILYLIPIAAALLLPVLRRRREARRYVERQSWIAILISIVVAGALIYGSYLVLRWLAPIVLPLGGPLLLMGGFSLVIAAYLGLFAAWLMGMGHALRARLMPLPVIGGWGERLYARLGS